MAGVSYEISVEEQQALKAISSLIKKVDDFEGQATKSFNNSSKAFDVFKGVLSAELAIKGLEKLGDAASELFNVFIVDGIKAAQQTQDALNQLNTALSIQGGATKDAIKGFEEYANVLEATSRASDAQIISAASLLQNLAPLTNTGLKTATKATLDLSAALGVDLETAARLVGRAANGDVEAFKRYGLTLQKTGDDATTFALAINQINAKFGGSAEAQVSTFAGATDQLSKSFENLTKEFGFIVINNPVVIAAINLVADQFKSLRQFIEDNKDSISAFITDGVVKLIGVFSQLLQTGKNIIEFFRQNEADIKSYGQALLIAIGIYGAFVIATNAATIATIALNAALAVADGLLAVLASPITLIVAGIALLAFGIKQLIDNFDLVSGKVKIFTGELLSSLSPAISTVLGFLGKIVSFFSKDLGDSITNFSGKIKTFSAELIAEGNKQVESFQKSAQAKTKEVSDFSDAESKKVEAAKVTNDNLLNIKQVEIDIEAQTNQAKAEQTAEFEATIDSIKGEASLRRYDQLVESLGQEAALVELNNIRKLEAEGKYYDARIKLRELDKKAQESDFLFNKKFEEKTNKEKINDLKSTFGTISTLQSSSSQELFAIGKAAAIANATIDGIAATQKALTAAPPPFNFALAALVGVASAANIAKIAASQPPGRQAGGFVPGAFSPTDNTLINAAGGELVLNRRQQTDLFNFINSGANGNTGSVNITFNDAVLDDDSRIQQMIERINNNVQFRNARLVTG